jgi:type VI secretion system secreted protein VgrG
MAIERLGDTAQFRLSVGELKDNQLRVLRFKADEGISRLFEVDLELVSEDASIQFDAVVGQPAALVVDLGGEPRYFNGIVTRFEQGAIGKRYTRYYARVAPRLWLLHHRVNSRIWEKTSVLDIVDAVLADAGIPTDTVDWRIPQSERGDSGRYKPREYCVQYQESDWDLISRLCEEEGIFYWFQHTEDQHKIVFADNASAHETIAGDATIPYRDPSGTVVEREYVSRFRRAEAMQPGSVLVRDFCFKTPKVSLDGRATGEDRSDDDREIFEYPAGHHEADLGGRRANVRLEEHQALRHVGSGESVCQRLTPGYRFTLADHGRDDFNAEYLLAEVSHAGFQPQAFEQEQPEPGGEEEYKNSFRCIPASVVYRPPRVTPRPRIRGTQSAVVVGPADSDEEIYTDEYGRVRVRFHWDRAEEGKSSCWVRVSQQWAGPGFGFMTIPRVGHEVVVAFFEGDPDQPHVIGRVYNADNMPPYTLPDEKTKSTIKTASSPGGEGFNEIRFEDKKDEEQIFIHAQKQMDLCVGESRFETVKKDRHLVVENDKYEHVKNERHVKADADAFEELGKDHHLKVTGKQAVEVGDSHSFTVGGDVVEVFQASHSEEVSSDYYLKALGIVVEASATGITLKCGSNSVVIDQTGVTVKGNLIVLDGQMVNIASGPGSPAMSGTAGSAVSPTAPDAAFDADEADPGSVAEARAQQAGTGEGKYGQQPIRPLTREDADDPEKTWIEIELVDEEGNPVPGERYEITGPDGETLARGTLDGNGFARVEGLDPGQCTVTFPELDREAWEPEA